MSSYFQNLARCLFALSNRFILSLLITYPALANAEVSSFNQTTVNHSSTVIVANQSLLSDGAYLFGQSDQPDQLGEEYIVFQVKGDRLLGAFYMPSSEFSCFSGVIVGNHLKLAILDPYENVVYPYAIALEPASPIATTHPPPMKNSVGLEGYQRLAKLSSLDHHILGICLNQVE